MPQVAVEDLTLPQLLRVLRRHGVTLPVVERPRSHYIALCQARGITSVDTFGISEIGVESFGGITLRGEEGAKGKEAKNRKVGAPLRGGVD